MRFVLRSALVVGSAALVQVALFSQLPVAGVRLPALLLVAVAAGLGLGAERGAAVGFAAGLTFDLLLTTPLGLCAGVFAVTGHAVARFRQPSGRGERWWRLPVTVAVASALAYLAVVLVGWALAQRPTPDRLVILVAVVGAANGALGPVAVRVMRWVGADAPVDVSGFGVARGR